VRRRGEEEGRERVRGGRGVGGKSGLCGGVWQGGGGREERSGEDTRRDARSGRSAVFIRTVRLIAS
jgi:hypothetical protein